MKKKSRLHKLMTWLVTLAMMLSVMQGLTLVTFAASISKSYDYKIKVKNSGDKKSGTDADVFCIVKTHDGARHQVKIDSGANDFEKNDCREYTVNLECQPWEIKEVGLRNSGKDGMKVAWFEWKNPDGSVIRKEINEWFENQKNKTAEHTYYVWVDVDRQIKTTGNFDSQFSGNKFYNPGTKTGQSDIVMHWNGKVSDQYFNSEYDFFKYFGATSVEFYPSATSYGYSGISSIDGLTENNIAKVEAANSEGFDNKITLYTNRLLDFMQRNEIFKLDIKSKIDYLYTSDEYDYHEKNYTITRTGFKLEDATVITAAYIPQENKNYKDSRFFNSNPEYKTFEIRIPVKNMNNYSASSIAASLVNNINNKASVAKVYYDKINTGRYITPKKVYTSGANIYFVCDVPAGFANPEGVGLTVVIENPKATYNNQTYTLYQKNENGQYVTNYEYKISTHKVDTKGLTHTVKDEKDNVINPATGFDTYKKEHQFKLEVDPGQKIFVDNNKGGRTEGNFSYRLYSKDGKSEIELVKHNGLVATSNVPHTGGTAYKIASANNVEGEYRLTITSKDLANNLSTTNIPVKIDNLAPRATYTVKQVDSIDGSRRNEYKFNIEDASETGKLHYVFVRDGQSLPATTNTKPDSSGPQDTLYEKWGFISQTNSNAQTVVLDLAKGEYFKGRLYWYTDDEAGNDSRKESKTGKDGNGYYYKDIELSNADATCDIILDDVTPGKPEYDIEFKTNSNNKVHYRWISSDLTTPYFEYTSSSEPGNGTQKNGSGISVTMNGEYTLEYRVTAPDGTKKSYTKEFVFDNNKPTITFESQDKAITESRNITITVKDISNIETIKYQLLTSSGEAMGEETVLPAGLPVVSNEVVLTPEKTGAYKIKVTATDVNGQKAEKESFVFSVRNSAPSIKAEDNIQTNIGGVPITNSQTYNIDFSVSEKVDNLDDFDENQVLQYRTSGDGVNYSDWTVITDVDYKTANNELFAEVTLESPVALNEGDNRVYIQAMFTEKGADASRVRNEFVAANSETIIIYDTEAPQYKLEVDNVTATNKTIPGTLTITDNYTAADKVSFENKVAGSCTSNQLSVSDMIKVMSLEFYNNTDAPVAFVLKDTAGNVTEIPIVIDCIDYDPPKVTAENSVHITNGDRTDFYLSFWIDEAMDEKTSFALVETEDYEIAPTPTYGAEMPDMEAAPEIDPSKIEDNLFGPMPDNIKVINKETQRDYENGETKTYYEVQVYADEEQFPDVPEDDETYWDKHWDLNNKTYMLASKTEDAVGNSSKQSIGYAMRLRNGTARAWEANCIPEKAGTKSVVYLGMSVPVFLMPESKVPDAMKNLADGRIDTINDAAVEEFAESVVNNVTAYNQSVAFTVSKNGDHPIFFADECGRVYKQTIKIKPLADRETDEDYENVSAYVDFGAEAPVTVTLYEAAFEDYDPANWTEKSTDNLKALELEGAHSYFVVLEGNNDTVSFETDWRASGGYENPDFEFIDGLSEFDYETYTYKKLVFELNNTPSSNRFVSSTVYYTNQDVEETAGFVYELDLVDVTTPIVDAYYSTTGYTKDPVKVTISATDPELSVSTDAGDTNPAGSNPTAGEAVALKPALSAEALAKNAGIASIEVSEITATQPSDYAALSYGSPIKAAETVVAFETNGYAVVRVTNTEGLVTYKEIEVNNINSNPIEKDVHYGVNYYYKNSEGNEILCDPDAYYKEVIAKIELTDAALERELAVTNNNLENTKTLNSFDNMFVFKLKDKFGHTVDVDVSFSRFDTTGPIADFEILNKAKTNQPVEVELKATDLHSMAASASLTSADGRDIPVTFDRDETDPETQLVTKVFKASVGDSGFYKMTVTDILGNKTYKNFSVTNIDKTAPYVVETKATSVEPTRQSVGVKLYYSEPNVVITRVELNESSSFTEDDVYVDYNNSVVRLDENGTVSVWYADEYGNECVEAEVITVGNIERTEPSLSAVTELAEDSLSVYVQFAKNPEERRDLSDLYVMYGGTSPVITNDITGEERIATAADMVKTADGKDFRFRFYDNGTYTFYVYDAIGNIQELPVEISGIDRKAPVITEVKWSYSYFDADGNEKEVVHTITPGDEAGYSIVEDATHLPTNQDITATVTTDDPTKFVGSSTKEYNTTHSVVFDEDGWFNFDLQKSNNLMDRYGLGLYLIDKVPPVIEGVEDLIFFENENANATPYSQDLLVYSAYDERNGLKTDLTDKVEIDWGGFVPGDINANTFDKNSPYTITYTVKDKVGNVTSVKRKITLVGLFDTTIRVNGKYPDSSGRIEVIGDTVEIALDNFGGTAYARYEKGIYTMGEMKRLGTVIDPTGDKFKLDKLSTGWYTFYVQTDLKDYFCVNVYIFGK